MNQVSILGTMAFGLTVCLVMGLFDLSIAAMATLGGYVATFLLVQYPDTISVPLAVLISLAVAGAIGVFNGLIVSYLGISAFIATLATGSIITGAMLGISNSKTIITGIPDEFLVIGQGSVFGVSNPILIMLAIGVILWLLLEHTQLAAISTRSAAARRRRVFRALRSSVMRRSRLRSVRVALDSAVSSPPRFSGQGDRKALATRIFSTPSRPSSSAPRRFGRESSTSSAPSSASC